MPVKQQRLRFKLLALLIFGLFLLLALYGGYSIVTYGNRWFASSKNPRVRAQKQAVVAGDITDRSGVVLATTNAEGERVYQADEASRRAVVHLLGDTQGQVSNGVETFQTSYLYGFQSSFWELLTSALTGRQRRGDDVALTIDSRLCTKIAASFNERENSAGKRGAAVVMNYQTGEVLAFISLPNFDPMNITEDTKADSGQPFWNRATQSVYAPGSTFKTITTIAALDHIQNVTEISISCTGGLDIDGHAIRDYGNAVHNSLTLKKAFTVSCNNVYALVAVDVGDEALRKTAESFGFNDNFLFRDLVVENSSYPTTNRTTFEVATSGFGQSAITATPMHMCMVAAAIANRGVMMEPRLLRQVTGSNGTQRIGLTGKTYRTATTEADAAVLKNYMRQVVTSGTGTRAQVSGLKICGKTGTAESSLAGHDISYAWFIGFADSDELPFAVSVIVEDIDDGLGGGSVAAPIAHDIFAYLKEYPERVTK